MTRADRALATVEALLDRQRQALLMGDLETLTQLPDRLSGAMRQLADQPPHAADLARLRGLADHNARLLAAARGGIAQVRARPGAAGAQALTTYDAAGRQNGASPTGRLLSRR